MARFRSILWASLVLLTTAPIVVAQQEAAGVVPNSAAAEKPEALRGVGVQQKIDAELPLDLNFRDEKGETVRLGQFFGERPVLLSFVYYECPMLCTLVLNGLTSALNALAFSAGEEFDVVTVSIDPNEGPELAAAKKQAHLDMYRRPSAAAGWHFLTGDADSIKTLADSVGFTYRYEPELDEFSHPAAIVVLTPQGHVSRYFLGVEYSARDLRFALVEAAANRIGTVVDQALLFCFRYDPATGKYTPAILNIVRLGGIVTILAMAAFIFGSRRRKGPGAGGSSQRGEESGQPTAPTRAALAPLAGKASLAGAAHAGERP